MSRCEDYPACGHEAGCCPDFDKAGNQLNMKCTCGAVLPIDARYSICDACMKRGLDSENEYFNPDDYEFDDEEERRQHFEESGYIEEDHFSRFDDDPDPYSGTYSEE